MYCNISGRKGSTSREKLVILLTPEAPYLHQANASSERREQQLGPDQGRQSALSVLCWSGFFLFRITLGTQMACGATLKRTMDFDPLMSPASPKRRRCVPIMSTAASTSSPQKYLRMEPSPFGEVVSSRLTTGRNHFIQNVMLLTN